MTNLHQDAALALMSKHHLVIALLTGVCVGVAYPAPGVYAGQSVNGTSPLQIGLVMLSFLVSGVKLKLDSLVTAVKEVKGNIWGLFSISFLTCVVGIKMTRAITFPVPEFQTGLVIYFAMPTTITLAIVMSMEARLNPAIALLLSAGSSVLSVFTVPPMLSWIGGFDEKGIVVQFDVVDLIEKLVLTVFMPILVSKVTAD